MSYSYDKFLRPTTSTDRNIQIVDNNGIINYTINPFSVIDLLVNNNLLKINLRSKRVITIPFSTTAEAKLAITNIQLQIDSLKSKVPGFIDKQVENYVENKFIEEQIYWGNGLTLTGSTVSVGGTLYDTIYFDGSFRDLIAVKFDYISFTSSVFDVVSDFVSLDSTDTAQFLADSDITIVAGGELSLAGESALISIGNTQGLVYYTDYSSGFINRSLVDKEYVDTAVSTAIGSNNELSEILTNGRDADSSGFINDNLSISSLNLNLRVLYDSTGGINSISWDDRILYDSNGNGTIDYENDILYSDLGVFSVDWKSRLLYNSNGVAIASWSASNDQGLEYLSDFTGTYATYSLVHKGYVDTQISNISQINSQTFSIYSNNTIVSGNILPDTDISYDLGSTSSQFRSIYVGTGSIYIGGLTLSSTGDSLVVNSISVGGVDSGLVLSSSNNNLNVSGDLIVQGNMTVNGTTSTINTENLLVKDPLILLASQQITPNFDSGILINRGTGLTQGIIWDESEGHFALVSTTQSSIDTPEIVINDYSNLKAKNIVLETITISEGAQSNYILISDSLGNASWTASIPGTSGTSGSSGTSGLVSFTLPDTPNPGQTWILLGTWNTSQAGHTLRMTLSAHAGYNAGVDQNQTTVLYFATSNGISTNPSVAGYYANGSAERNINLGTQSFAPSIFRIVQSDTSTYLIYGNFGQWAGNSHYTISTSGATTWAHSGVISSTPSGTYLDITPGTSGTSGLTPTTDWSLSGGLTVSGTSSLLGLTVLQEVSEVINTTPGATASTVVYDFSTGANWYHSSANTNYTANFINVPTSNNRVITTSIVINQSSTAYIPTSVQINSVSQTIKWSAGTAAGTPNQVDIVGFTFIRDDAGNWAQVLGQINTFD